MKKTSLLMSIFLVATAIGAAVAASAGCVAKADVLHGVISIAFDDNYQNQYDYAFPLLQARGIDGTFYVVTNQIRDISGDSMYMTLSELQTLEASGNEIGSHSKTHTRFTELSDSQIRSECQEPKQILQSNGLSATNFAYPDGVTNDHVDSIVDDYYRSGRTAYVAPYLMDAPTNQFRLAGFSAETGDTTALSKLKTMVDQVYSANGWAVIFFHNIKPDAYWEPYTTTTQDFASFLDYVQSKGVKTLTVNQALDLTVSLMPLSLTTNYGTVTPASGDYTFGTTLLIEAFPPSAVSGERYVWLGWSGSGAGSYSGDSNPATITLNDPIIQTASWVHQYEVSLVSSGVGSDFPGSYVTVDGSPYADGASFWWDSGSTHNFAFQSELSVSNGKRYVWESSSGLSTHQSGSVSVSGPGVLNVNYKTQYYMDVVSPYGIGGGSGWYDSGATAYATLDKDTISVSSDTRYVFTGWSEGASGDGLTSDAIAVNGPFSAVASWKKQYLIVFNQNGLPADFNASVLIGSASRGLPLSSWVDEGEIVQFAFPAQWQGEFGTRYVLESPLNYSSLEVNAPATVTAHYEEQIVYESYAVIAVPAVVVFFAVTLLALRWRKSSRQV